MRVFKYVPPEGTCLVVPEDDSLANIERLSFYEKRRMAQEWRPVPVRLVWELRPGQRSGKRRDADFLYPSFGTLTLNERAKTALGSFLAPFGELLPLSCEGNALYVLNVTNVVDAMDLTQSEIIGSGPYDTEAPPVTRVAFRPQAVKGETIFRVKQRSVPHIFFTQAFINEVERLGLTGLGYRVEWQARE